MGGDIRISSRYLDRISRLIQWGLSVQILRPGVESDLVHAFEEGGYFVDDRVDVTTATFPGQDSSPESRGNAPSRRVTSSSG